MTPPLNLSAAEETERGLLGCLLVDSAAVFPIAINAGLAPDWFSLAPHRIAYLHALALYRAGHVADVVTLAQAATAAGDFAALGGNAGLVAISNYAITTAHLGKFLEDLHALHRRRLIDRAGRALVELAAEKTDAGELLLAARREFDAATGGVRSTEPNWPQVVADFAAEARRIIAREEDAKNQTLPWPWPSLNRAFLPLRRGELCVIAARPSVGKSSLMRSVAFAAARAGRNVLIESIEVSAPEIAAQAASSASGVSFSALAEAHAREQADFLAAVETLALPNLHVFSRDATLDAIAARAKALHATAALDLLAIDYLGLISDCESSRSDTKASAIGRVTKGLKRLAGELNIPIILLAQLNRQSAQTGNREPVLTDLRDSGDIEQDADRVVFLHRPDKDPLTGRDQSQFEDAADRPRDLVNAIQGKGRNVGAGQIFSFYFTRAVARFDPATRQGPVNEPINF